MTNELDEDYIEMTLEKYRRIKSIVFKGKRPTRYEKELISLIFNKMVDPYYYWAEARVKVVNENVSNKDPKELRVQDISELATKYDLDISEMNDTPSRIKLKRYLDKGFEELNARMKKIGYSYERGSRSFVK
jgi:cell fate regulator YaaT (PSP1 superfamily)